MTKKDENNTSEKEVYRLWWEYLKRSEKYKTFCAFIRKAIQKLKKGDIDKPAVLDKLITPLFTSGKFNSDEIDYMNRYFEKFGDIFTEDFDDWWKTVKKSSEQKLPIIVLNDPNACKAMPFFAEAFKKQQKARKKPLSPKEMINILTEAENEFIFLAVPMVGGVTMSDISKQMADIRKKWAKEFDIEDYHSRRFNMPVSRVRYDELKRYLTVYDLHKQGLKMKEIISKIDPNRCADDANVQRSFHMDLQKAKEVIKNVEFGSFPRLPLAGQEYQIIKNMNSSSFPELLTDN